MLALTCHIELFTQAHYRAEHRARRRACPTLCKDVFLFHWKEESQHAILDELEWRREDAQARRRRERDRAVDDLIALVGAVDGILQAQAAADADYFLRDRAARRSASRARSGSRRRVLRAYRWQYIVSGVQEPRFQKMLGGMITRGADAAHRRRAGAHHELRQVLSSP